MPSETHAPRLGLPPRRKPAGAMVTAGSWLISAVFTLLRNVRRTATFAVQGSSSLTHAPDSPRRANSDPEDPARPADGPAPPKFRGRADGEEDRRYLAADPRRTTRSRGTERPARISRHNSSYAGASRTNQP
jgi:hypothetical protein